MIINDSKILRNGDKIFKSQVTDSYAEYNATSYHYVYLELSGATANDPLYMYYKTPNDTKKFTLYSSIQQQTLEPTNENSYKKFYFSNNLDSVLGIRFLGNHYYWSGFYYRGDLIKLMNQFPNLRDFRMTDTYGYVRSEFNKNISNSSFPKDLATFHVSDTTLYGDVDTIKNFEKIEDLKLYNCSLSGIISNVDFVNLRKLEICQLSNIYGNLDVIFENQPNFESIIIVNSFNLTGNVTNWDVSNLNYIYLNIYGNNDMVGDITDWIFNTGLTYLLIYNKNLDGDISNWDIGNTLVTNFSIQNNYGNYNKIEGSLSGWTLPNTINQFSLSYISGITSIPENYSNTNLNYFSVAGAPLVVQNINDFIFNSGITTIYIYDVGLYGDVGNLTLPPNLQTIQLENCDVSGDIENLELPASMTSIYVLNTQVSGNVALVEIPNSMTYIYFSYNTGLTLNLNVSGLTLTNKQQFLIRGISGITGDLSNIVVNGYLDTLAISDTPCDSDLSKLDLTNIGYFEAQNCDGIFGDLTGWLTGTTQLYGIAISNNPLLSGDTTNWEVDDCQSFLVGGTALSGALKHSGLYYFDISYTQISSNVETDFDYSGVISFYANNSNITGNLSGVSLNYGLYRFTVSSCPNLFGANEFISYLFENRRNWSWQYGIYIEFQSIGDNVSGATEQLGDLGTWSGNQWDLSEEQVNNLVLGTDYDGNGTNIPWNSKQKVYWMQYALVSSSISNRRYVIFYFLYS